MDRNFLLDFLIERHNRMITNLADLTTAVNENTDAINALIASENGGADNTIPQTIIDQINANTAAAVSATGTVPTTPPAPTPVTARQPVRKPNVG